MNKVVGQAKAALATNPRYCIRKMYLSDVDRVAELDPIVFGEMHWTRNIFTNELANPNASYFVASKLDEAGVDTSEVLGYGGAWHVLDEMHIMTLGTDPDYRRQKIAESIIIALIADAIAAKIKSISLEVRLSNAAAQKLYARYDFQQQGIRKNYYESDGESALILWTPDIQTDEFQKNYLKQLDALSMPQAS
ncbi:MAG: ribosomal protein S18-alanine N-acetyltransferase [Candidatus Melainabacteria bacterium]|jgi:[ribosomal protein S18]-alanine N-acetyltransferase|nr:ribosomal protein S18-alanine N-acetyltransferase [Candidatus Melainabacteria bacterium]